MPKVLKIEARTTDFIREYKRLKTAGQMPDFEGLAKILGLKSKSTISEVLGLRQNIQPAVWDKFKGHFKIMDGAPDTDKSEQDTKKPGTVGYQADELTQAKAEAKEANAVIRGYNDFLQRMLESSLEKILKDQVGSAALIGMLLQRDVEREAGGNPEIQKQILDKILRKIGPRLSSSMKDDIVHDGRT